MIDHTLKSGEATKGQYNFNCYAYLNSLKIPSSVLHNIGAASPNQDYYDPAFTYTDVYNLFFLAIGSSISSNSDRKRAELRKELASIAVRKQFARQNKDKAEHSLFVKDAIERSSEEYQEKIQQQLWQLESGLKNRYDN